jgi:hypothetical protein
MIFLVCCSCSFLYPDTNSTRLAIEELPLPPGELSPYIDGLYLVDHNRVRSDWGEAGAKAVKGVLDHHNDLGMFAGISCESVTH